MLSFQCPNCGKNALRKFICSNCGNDEYNEAEHDILFKENDGSAIMNDIGNHPSYLNCTQCGSRKFSPSSMDICMNCLRKMTD